MTTISVAIIVIGLIGTVWSWTTSPTYRDMRTAWWAEQRRRRAQRAADRRWARTHRIGA
jgi:hypothetical protein